MALTLTTLFSDNFNRSNVSPLTTPWQLDLASSNGLEIVNDLCDGAYVSSPSPSNNGGQVYANTLPNDQFVSATVSADALVSGVGISVKARAFDTLDVRWDNCPGYRATFSNNAWSLYSDQGSGVLGSGAYTLNVGDVVSVACVGTTIYVLQNSTILRSFTNTNWSSGSAILGISNDGVDATFGVVSLFAVGSAAVASGGGGGSSTVFLGSVVEVGSVPSGRPNPFIGTYKVVTSAPSGDPNPFLGSIFVGSPSGSQNNPSLGEVVVLTQAPAGEADPFLGTASTD